MKVKLSLLLVAFAVFAVHADIETCSEVADCSEAMKSKCDDMSKVAEESDGDKKHRAVLACQNSICMCNLQFAEHMAMTDTPSPDQEEPSAAENPESST